MFKKRDLIGWLIILCKRHTHRYRFLINASGDWHNILNTLINIDWNSRVACESSDKAEQKGGVNVMYLIVSALLGKLRYRNTQEGNGQTQAELCSNMIIYYFHVVTYVLN